MAKRLSHYSWCLLIASLSNAFMFAATAKTVTTEKVETEETTQTAPSAAPDDDDKKHKKHKKDEKSDATAPDAPRAAANQAPCISWVNPIVKPKVILLCIHGLGLYSGSYKDFGMIMSRRGVGVYAIDVRGFGSWMKSGGKQEVDFNGCLEDIRAAITSIRAANPGLPFYLLGESMGGAIALRFASEHPDMIDGLISSVPAGDRFQQKKTDLKVALELLKGPNKQFDIGNSIVKQATKNDKLRSDWADDPLDRMDLSPKDLLHFQKFMNENHDAAKSITALPVLFVQGTRDRLVKPEGTWDLFNQLNTDNKFFFAVPSEHLIFEETQDDNSDTKLKNFRLLTAWILTQSKVDTRQIDPQQSAELLHAIDNLVGGLYVEAKSTLTALVKQDPKNADAHYWLALAYLKSKQSNLARQEFERSVNLGKGSDSAKQANSYLMTMSQTPDPSAPAAPATPAPVAADVTKGKPTVLAFYAPWCEQSDKLDQWFQQARTTFGDRVQLQKINVDDETSAPMVDRFKIGPIPTLVFLSADGSVSASIIGQTSFVNIAQDIGSIMRLSAPPAQPPAAPSATRSKAPTK